MTTGKMYERVAIEISDAEILTLGKELAAKEAEYTEIQEEKSEALNTFNARLKTNEAERADISWRINNRHKEVDVEYREEFDYGRKMVLKVRADNGQPFGKPRPMTLNEEGEEKMRELRNQQELEDVNGVAEADAPADAGEKPKKGRGRKGKNSEATDDATASD